MRSWRGGRVVRLVNGINKRTNTSKKDLIPPQFYDFPIIKAGAESTAVFPKLFRENKYISELGSFKEPGIHKLKIKYAYQSFVAKGKEMLYKKDKDGYNTKVLFANLRKAWQGEIESVLEFEIKKKEKRKKP
jgi:hypothetical protein